MLIHAIVGYEFGAHATANSSGVVVAVFGDEHAHEQAKIKMNSHAQRQHIIRWRAYVERLRRAHRKCDRGAMKISRAIALLFPFTVAVSVAHAEPAVAAQMLCGVFNAAGDDVDFVVPTPDGRKITRPIACAIHATAAPKTLGALKASLWITTNGAKGAPHTAAIALDKDFELVLKPPADFASCTTFDIQAQIESHDGVVWAESQTVTQKCAGAAAPTVKAPKIKATFDCWKDLPNGKDAKIGNETTSIEGKSISCKLESKTDIMPNGSHSLVLTSWHSAKDNAAKTGKPVEGSPIAEGDSYYYTYDLIKGVDWDTCAPDITVVAKVLDGKEQPILEMRKVIHQTCAATATATAKAPAVLAKFSNPSMKEIPAGARDIAVAFANACVAEDRATLTTLAGTGILRGKKVVSPAVASNARLQGFEAERTGDDRQWQTWTAQKKSANGFLLCLDNISGYGVIQCASFSKSANGEWTWVAIVPVDQGAP